MEPILNYIRTTTTNTGLHVSAALMRNEYRTRFKVSEEQLDAITLTRDATLPNSTTQSRPPRPRKHEVILAQTLANGGKLLDGTLGLSAAWAADANGGAVESAIRDIGAVSGGARLTIGGTEVSLIAFQDSIDSNGVTFSGPTESKVLYVTGAEQSSTDLTTEPSGQFIDESLDGPIAVLGKKEGGGGFRHDRQPMRRGRGPGTVADGTSVVAGGGGTQR